MPLPLQLTSWKGCIAELMAQPNFRVSLLKTMSFGAGNGVWKQTILMSPQSTLGIVSARSPSFTAAASTNICRGCHELCSCSARRVCANFACDLAYLALGTAWPGWHEFWYSSTRLRCLHSPWGLATLAVPERMLCLAVCPGFPHPRPLSSLWCKSVSVVCSGQAYK